MSAVKSGLLFEKRNIDGRKRKGSALGNTQERNAFGQNGYGAPKRMR